MPRAAHSFVERLPDPALAGLVSAVYVQRVEPGGAPWRHRHVPNGSAELICRVGGAPVVLGPLTEPVTRVLAPGTTVVGLRLRPGAAPAVLGMPASEVAGREVGADAFWGAAAAARVAAAPTPRLALAALQAHVAGRGDTPDPLVAAAVRLLMPRYADPNKAAGYAGPNGMPGHAGPGGVAGLTAALRVSERSLRRRCLAAVGMPPKTLHRLLRFQGVLAAAQRAIAQGRDPGDGGLARLATDHGYADHSHLDRECRRLTGTSVRAFLLETAEQCGCGHDHAASYDAVLPVR
ncbi:helix-turn-helix domain-containing protein [Dactylosporangium aurantiacum]|uniref:Helix-turn-helix domain-containing protein n=1 Tax=Dactylosporangium aurantiacum TaxID=35754 RepID=A0A9Q9IGK7_9ACTN|nr:DUF6597 domain-containing transcriptional factor [Dactylosporangium aurantiacum]MDG6107480.1 helix-turn-helix domain-containing protein [Dactylosporangium aurantiacum]UWZ54273.1 helix-turn-helix domain-containing protein [Dactylosporangium aurantiacum]